MPKVGLNTLTDIHPELLSEWSKENNQLPTNYVYTSPFRALWRCPKCHNDYSYPINERRLNDNGCPFCDERLAKLGVNTIVDKKPGLLIEWSSENSVKPEKLRYFSAYSAIWICSKCHGEYSMPVREREENDNCCPYCSNRKPLVGLNTVADKKPLLAMEWSRNNKFIPSDYVFTSSYRVLWICPRCQGEYPYGIKHRDVNDDSCPYCLNNQVLLGFNSFAVKHANLLEDWDYINNSLLLDPDQIMDTCNIKVWWKCPENPGHRFSMSPKQMLYYKHRNINSCPYCRGYRRKKRHFI